MEKEFQRWTARRKVELLLQLIKRETKLVDACREHDLKQSEVESWMEAFLQAGERGLKARSEGRAGRPRARGSRAPCEGGAVGATTAGVDGTALLGRWTSSLPPSPQLRYDIWKAGKKRKALEKKVRNLAA